MHSSFARFGQDPGRVTAHPEVMQAIQ